MGLPQLKKELHDFIDNADEQTLKKVHAMIQASQDEEIVAYTVTGEPLTRYGLRKQLEEGKKQIDEGKYYTTDEIKQRIKEWAKKY